MGWRTLLGLPIAGAIVMFLFLFMAGAIHSDEVPVVGKVLPKLTMPKVPDETPIERSRPVPPEAIKPPPPPEFTESTIDTPTIDGGKVGPPKPPEGPGTLPVLDTEPTPIVTVAPQGFERCLDDGAETHRVRLLFDISPAGETANIEVIDATDDCFNRYAIRALRQWRYTPKVVNGEPVWQYGRQATIVIESE